MQREIFKYSEITQMEIYLTYLWRKLYQQYFLEMQKFYKKHSILSFYRIKSHLKIFPNSSINYPENISPTTRSLLSNIIKK